MMDIQVDYLQKQFSLCDLLAKVDSHHWFTHGSTFEVNADNITFGPRGDILQLAGEENLKMKVIGYCLLYYVF